MEIDLSHLDARTQAAVDGRYQDKFHRDLSAAIARQTATAKAREDGLPWRDDLRPQYEIDPMVDSLWRQFYGHNYTENPDLMHFLQARNPEIVVKSRSGKTQIGWTPRLQISDCGLQIDAAKSTHRTRTAIPNPQSAIRNPQSRRAVRFDRGTMEFAR